MDAPPTKARPPPSRVRGPHARAKPVNAAHMPCRPSWRCSGCDHAWPCVRARADLLAEYAGQPTTLTVYLAACLHEATDDLAAADPPPELYDRFLSWVRA